MSLMGQTEKTSHRAHVFRFAPESGHERAVPALPDVPIASCPAIQSRIRGSGQDSITGFEGGFDNDRVDLRGFGLADFTALQSYLSQVGADTVITLNGADILTLKNINSGTLFFDDFFFV